MTIVNCARREGYIEDRLGELPRLIQHACILGQRQQARSLVGELTLR
jgi:hypothetical protein